MVISNAAEETRFPQMMEIYRQWGVQLQLLEASCRSYDSGMEAAGKHIALSIRLLVHQPANRKP